VYFTTPSTEVRETVTTVVVGVSVSWYRQSRQFVRQCPRVAPDTPYRPQRVRRIHLQHVVVLAHFGARLDAADVVSSPHVVDQLVSRCRFSYALLAL
jgi:hypothetical protein